MTGTLMRRGWSVVGALRVAGRETVRRAMSSKSKDKKDNIAVVKQQQDEHPPNNSITPGFVNNRNPRNLERLRLAEKAMGWDLEKSNKGFWNKLVVELTGKHITAKVFHVSGHVPVTASTNEWCIKKFLYSTKDDIAAKTVGQVLANRCLQMGITEVACLLPEEDRKKEKVSLILSAVEEGGVSLEEPEQIMMPWALNDYRMPEKSWDIYEDISEKLDEADELLNILKKNQKQRS